MIILYSIVGFILLLIVANSLTNAVIYGKTIDDSQTYKLLENKKLKKEYFLSSLDSYTMCDLSEDFQFITKLPFPLFSKYYINGVGTVPRWSKTHKLIEQYIQESKLENL